MNAQKITRKLLEDDFDAKELLNLDEWLISKFPREIHGHLKQGNAFGPSRDFLEAMAQPKEQEVEWQFNDPDDLPVWPSHDGDDGEGGFWVPRFYFCMLAVRSGELWVQRMEADPHGDAYLNEEALWGSPDHLRMRKDLSRRASAEADIAYIKDVLKTGHDPLEWSGSGKHLLHNMRNHLARAQAKLADPHIDDPTRPTFVIP